MKPDSSGLALVVCMLLLGGCASFNLSPGDTPAADLSAIPASSAEGREVTVRIQGGFSASVNFGGSSNYREHVANAFKGSGFFSNVSMLDWNNQLPNQGTVVNINSSCPSKANAIAIPTVVLAIATAYVFPAYIPCKASSEVTLIRDGETVSTLNYRHKASALESSLPIYLPLGKTHNAVGKAYAAIIVSNTLMEMHRENLL